MDKTLPYLLLTLLLIVAWNDSLSNRLHRLAGIEKAAPENAATYTPVATSFRTPFWQQPDYKTGLDRADEKLDARQKLHKPAKARDY